MIARVALGVAIGLAIAGLVRLAVARFGWARALRDEAYGLHVPVTLAVAAAVAEEVVFRWFLLPSAGLLVSSAAFALCHLGPRARHLAWAAFAFGCGLALAEVTLLTGDIAAAVAAHVTANLAGFGAARRLVNAHSSERRTAGRSGHRGAPDPGGQEGRDPGARPRGGPDASTAGRSGIGRGP